MTWLLVTMLTGGWLSGVDDPILSLPPPLSFGPILEFKTEQLCEQARTQIRDRIIELATQLDVERLERAEGNVVNDDELKQQAEHYIRATCIPIQK